MSTIYFATNRNVKHETTADGSNFGIRFNEKGPQFYRVGQVEMAPGDDGWDWHVGTCTLYADDAADGDAANIGSAHMFEKLRKYLKENDCDVIVYIHGFNTDFERAARGAAQLQRVYGNSGKRAIVVMFSWPSEGIIIPEISYYSDRDDARLSSMAMARALRRLAKFLTDMRSRDRALINTSVKGGKKPDPEQMHQCQRKLHLVAHSMGNWALSCALDDIRSELSQTTQIFENTFLMAADVDEDALSRESKLGFLPKLSRNVYVYHAENDHALELSHLTKGNPDRLGSGGPAMMYNLTNRVVAVDCTDVSTCGRINDNRHQYFAHRDEVISDVVATLEGKPQDGRAGRTKVGERWWRLKAR